MYQSRPRRVRAVQDILILRNSAGNSACQRWRPCRRRVSRSLFYAPGLLAELRVQRYGYGDDQLEHSSRCFGSFMTARSDATVFRVLVWKLYAQLRPRATPNPPDTAHGPATPPRQSCFSHHARERSRVLAVARSGAARSEFRSARNSFSARWACVSTRASSGA